jgi:L-asparaginase
MQQKKVVILGTGGTIAGTSSGVGSAADNIHYKAGQVGVNQLVEAIPALSRGHLVMEQIAQADSKDMSFALWALLAERVQHHLALDDVQAVVITHGTDTLEETAYFLQALLSPSKPVVLTCAMRPADALAPDGPKNILDAVTVARSPNAQGVVVVCAGVVHAALDVQKSHTYRLDAFSSGDGGPIGYVEENSLRLLRNWPVSNKFIGQAAPEKIALLKSSMAWPRVEIVMNYAGAGGELVDLMASFGVRGLVVAGTGNGTVHQALEAALLRAQALGLHIVRSTRCAQGRVFARSDDVFPASDGLSPVKARIALMLKLMNIQP